MSACISRDGEYGSHTFAAGPANIWEEFTCPRCGVLSEYAMADEIERLRAASRPRVVTTAAELDALPAWSGVFGEGGRLFQKQPSSEGRWGAAGSGRSVPTSWLLEAFESLTVVWSPPVESGETQGGAS